MPAVDFGWVGITNICIKLMQPARHALNQRSLTSLLSMITTAPVSSITIRNLDPSLKEKLRVRAAEHGHSMEAEARRILDTALAGGVRRRERNLYERIHARFAKLGGVDLELPERQPAREPPRFD